MIPMIGLMIWAYGFARIVEILSRDGDRRPTWLGVIVMFIMLVVMCGSCVNLMMVSVKSPTGLP